jgi:N-acetylmuramoyl-L-alanine amidase
MIRRRSHKRAFGRLLMALAPLIYLIPPLSVAVGQETMSLRVQIRDGYLDPGLSMATHRGFVTVPAGELTRLGWQVEESGGRMVAKWRGGSPRVEATADNPFLSWGGEGVQLAEAPYVVSGRLYLPLQFFVDILPWKLPEVFRFEPDSQTLFVRDPSRPGGSLVDPVRVVVIDPGHGGPDPGAKGTRGTQEKDVALAIGLALARNLREDPNFRVYLTREGDSLIPIWKRGELATEWKGERQGIFVSIHANAMPDSRATRGFETYFLSEARTEHERRVAALENAAQEYEAQDDGAPADPDLSFILTELRNLDSQHWSALLAEMVQGQLAKIHPGPDRGVKQGPLAVITNALMPGVLVEVGFLTNPDEERLLNQAGFQENTAIAVGSAVREFFRRYPSGGATTRAGGEGS